MKSPSHPVELHRTHRVGWLRAAVLGANDGVLSTSSLVIGAAASNAGHAGILISGIAGLVAGSSAARAEEIVRPDSREGRGSFTRPPRLRR